MILIFSNDDDYSTTQVIRWLIKLNANFLRINDKSKIKILDLGSKDFRFIYENNIFSLSEFNSVWYRRGNINFEISDDSEYVNFENREIKNHIYRLLQKKKHVNTFFNSSINKLFVLSFEGFQFVKLPEFCITQSKTVALDFFKKQNGQVLSKPIFSPFKSNCDDGILMAYTSKLVLNDIESISDEFVPTFFQKYEEKKFEIRTFYLDCNFYSMCIFSQKNENTKVDFRNYDLDIPNRLSPFKLPKEIEFDLMKMFNYFKLDCASLDIIYNSNGYHLIDVNPIGQFGMVSYPCNFSLEKKIAEYLIKKDDR